MRGDGASPYAFCELMNLLLHQTVMVPGSSLDLQQGDRKNNYILSGRSFEPMALTDKRYLRIYMGLAIHKTKDGPRLKVLNSGFQYQADTNGKEWIFRYDYERNPVRPHPPTHFHLRGTLVENCLPAGKALDDIHFPATRVSLEAVIRLLIDQFQVRARTSRSHWRKLLTESEKAFMAIAHKALSGANR